MTFPATRFQVSKVSDGEGGSTRTLVNPKLIAIESVIPQERPVLTVEANTAKFLLRVGDVIQMEEII